MDGGVSLQITDGGTLSISTPLGNEARITETANSTFLTIITSFIEDYTNSSKGLSGYWNGNADDDFLLPNGTILPSNISDSQIHYDFGENCKLNNLTIKKYLVCSKLLLACLSTFSKAKYFIYILQEDRIS